jgi:hypothetical protein
MLISRKLSTCENYFLFGDLVIKLKIDTSNDRDKNLLIFVLILNRERSLENHDFRKHELFLYPFSFPFDGVCFHLEIKTSHFQEKAQKKRGREEIVVEMVIKIVEV